jgi:hypothetical protein
MTGGFQRISLKYENNSNMKLAMSVFIAKQGLGDPLYNKVFLHKLRRPPTLNSELRSLYNKRYVGRAHKVWDQQLTS